MAYCLICGSVLVLQIHVQLYMYVLELYVCMDRPPLMVILVPMTIKTRY